ncbi:hypothetical protein [Rhizorhabdus argentea]|uniref:hypothetical protein n=1 Tax=Rhizorhabdus argentea TaxID=1387174 RepID=UPI0030EC16A7
MSEAAVERLILSSEALITALDSHDVDALEAVMPLFGETVEALKALCGGPRPAALSPRLAEALKLADAARARVRYLSDRTQQRIDMLAVATGRFDCTPATYGRQR